MEWFFGRRRRRRNRVQNDPPLNPNEIDPNMLANLLSTPQRRVTPAEVLRMTQRQWENNQRLNQIVPEPIVPSAQIIGGLPQYLREVGWEEREDDHINGRDLPRAEAYYMPRAEITPSYKKGGRVKKTGLSLLHKGEFVVPANTPVSKAQKAKVAKLRKNVK